MKEAQWPQFRGPNAGVIPDDPMLPDTWSENENIVWKTPIPGLGWSSPIVWDDHIFLTSAVSEGREAPPASGLYDEHDHIRAQAEQRWVVYDIEFKTGNIRWQKELKRGFPPLLRHVKNSYASETAVTDGERVYVYFRTRSTRCRSRRPPSCAARSSCGPSQTSIGSPGRRCAESPSPRSRGHRRFGRSAGRGVCCRGRNSAVKF